MKYGIIGAMDSEVSCLIAELEEKSERAVMGVTYCSGLLAGREVVIAKCGVGKVNAALTAAVMLREFAPDAVINTGVSGALSPSLDVGHLALSTALVQHDFDTSPIGDPVGFVSGPNCIEFPADQGLLALARRAAAALSIPAECGVIASGDQFVADGARKAWIRDTFSAISCEMEGGAIAQVCHIAAVPVIVIRTISDRADGSAEVDFPSFAAAAARQSAEVVKAMLGKL